MRDLVTLACCKRTVWSCSRRDCSRCGLLKILNELMNLLMGTRKKRPQIHISPVHRKRYHPGMRSKIVCIPQMVVSRKLRADINYQMENGASTNEFYIPCATKTDLSYAQMT